MTQQVLVAVAAVCTSVSAIRAQVVIETVSVGNLGNAPDTRFVSPGHGGVDYAYNIAKYEVTAGQYTEFLNAVAKEDTHRLWNELMSGTWSEYACMIERTGSSPNYSYSVAADWADRPVNYVTWGNAARFANWLHNGQPTGPQNLSTTEDGSYYLKGAISSAELLAVGREPDATWVVPSQHEWYKAAYYDGVTGNYYTYSTCTDAMPSNDLTEPDPGNNATFYDDDYTLGGPYYRTEVGAHANSEGPYGTFDQGGNVWEWPEAIPGQSYCSWRGGSFSPSAYGADIIHAIARDYARPTLKFGNVGFRLARLTGLVPQDLDQDGDVDLRDYALFLSAITGPR